jgi:outer membrane protein
MTRTILLALVFGCSLTAMADVKIGLVDMQKAIQETADGKKAKTDLEADFNKKKKELEKRQADIRKMGEDLEKKATVLADDVKAKKQQEIQQEMAKYQDEVAKSQSDIQKRERDLTQPIINRIRKIIEDMAKKENFNIIMEKADQLVLYSVREIDLTERVVREYDSNPNSKK